MTPNEETAFDPGAGLGSETCVACRPDSPMLTDDELAGLLPRIPAWEMVEVKGQRRLRRVYRFDAWMPGARFALAVAEDAEAQDHHPTIAIAWGRVTVTWWTHAIGGLHRNDAIMAARCDALFAG